MEQRFLFLEPVLAWVTSLQTLDYLMLFAGLLALVAVYLFLRSDQTARHQIDREYLDRVAERELALRKEVYLPAADAIARAQDFLGKFPAMDMSRDQAQMVVDHVLGALGKAQLVATEASVKPVMAVAAEFSNSYLALAARRQPLAKLSMEITELSSAIEHLAVERDHMLARLTRSAADIDTDEAKDWQELSQRFDKLHREIGSLLGKRKDQAARRSALEQEFVVEAHQCALRLAKLAVPAYLALRDELRLKIDESQYRALAQRSINEIERKLKTLAEPAVARPTARRADRTAPRREPVVEPVDGAGDERLRVVLKRSG